MKLILLLYTISLSTSIDNCKSKVKKVKYKGRLEIAGICMNYTIKLLEGNIDTSKISASWRDEVTGKAYTNVFALANPCSFPTSIKQGDEFYFSIDTSSSKECMTCMAYYPKPPKKLPIKVIEK
ncbi:MAG TPA: hypothetical protein VGQ09_18600 [Chitinophagaceae bacterium]|jgi:hypothetical protein|nr:hypothetical protein [Chitinophagaceae bacterium]